MAKEIWHDKKARVFPPEDDLGFSTGHDGTGHREYNRQVRSKMFDEVKAYRREHKIKGRFTLEQQRDFAKRFLAKIDEMPPDSYIGGFNRAVKRGGTKAVEEFRDAFAERTIKEAREAAGKQFGKRAPRGKLLKAVGGIGLLGLVAGQVAIARNLAFEPEHVRVAKIEFLYTYRVALSYAQRYGDVPGHVQVNLFSAFVKYLDVIGADTSSLQWAWGMVLHTD